MPLSDYVSSTTGAADGFTGRRYLGLRVGSRVSDRKAIYAVRKCPEPATAGGRHLALPAGTRSGTPVVAHPNATAVAGARHLGLLVGARSGVSVEAVDPCPGPVRACVCGPEVLLPTTLYCTVTLPANPDTDPVSGVSIAMPNPFTLPGGCQGRQRGALAGSEINGNFVYPRPGFPGQCCSVFCSYYDTWPGIFRWEVVIMAVSFRGVCELYVPGAPAYILNQDCAGDNARGDADSIRCSPFLLTKLNAPLLRCQGNGSGGTTTTNLGNATWTISA